MDIRGVLWNNIRMTMKLRWTLVYFAVTLAFGTCKARSCRISEDLKIADCSNLYLTHVPTPELRKYRLSLETILLRGNKIQTVRNKDFQSFSKLQNLYLDDNPIIVVEKSAFDGLRNLRTLSMTQHQLSMTSQSFSHLLFRCTPNLTDLDLSTSYINTIDFKIRTKYPHKSFALLHNLRHLKLPLYPNSFFGTGFKKLRKLQTLTFRGCLGSILKNDTFSNFNASEIIELSITNCGYNDKNVLEENTFHAFPNLLSLDLSNSGFTFPTVMEALYGLRNKSMDTLNLYNVNPFNMMWSYRRSVVYSVRVTQHMTRYFRYMCVKNINIGKNGIVEMQTGTLLYFQNASCIRNYTVSENNFMIPFPKFFRDIMHFLRSTSMEAFSMSHMLMQYSTSDTSVSTKLSYQDQGLSGHWDTTCPTDNILNVICPPNLTYFDISYIIAPFTIQCKLNFTQCRQFEKFDFSYTTILDVGFQIYGIETTKHVILSGLDVSINGNQLLRNFRHAERLILRDANLDIAFKNGQHITSELKTTQHLDLASNHLTYLPNNSLEHINTLKSINLYGNSLSSFPGILLKNNNLRFIDIRENKLQGVNKPILDMFANNPEKYNNSFTILLRGNFFQCTCEYEDFIMWLYTTKMNLDDGFKNYTCTLENGIQVSTRDVYNHRQIFFENCRSKFWLIFSMSGVALLSLCVLGLAILYRFRWRVIYFCLRRCRSNYRIIDSNVYEFDAFVAYTGDDYKWVWNDVRSFMEEEKQLKLCLHEREFKIGESISQNIVDFMRDSRKIVFDVTPGYLKAKWCEFELEMANMESLQRSNDATVIVIIRNGVTPSDMPKLLKDIWHRVTCLPFSEDNEERDFWQSFYEAVTT